MAGKRRRDDEDASIGPHDGHPARKKRIEYTEADNEFAKIFGNLRDDSPTVRSGATVQLIKNIVSLEPGDQLQHRIDNAVTRLIKGTCSGAKAARLGFSMALAEVLRLGFTQGPSGRNTPLQIGSLVEKIVALSSPDGKTSGEEKRNHLLGRCFAFQAILQSTALGHVPQSDATAAFNALSSLAAEKQWLRMECGAILNDYLGREPRPDDGLVRCAIESWMSKGLLKTSEGVALWLTAKSNYPDLKLPKGHWHHNNPLASQDRPTLSKILLKSSLDDDETSKQISKKAGARQSAPSFAWDVIFSQLFQAGSAQKFGSFWSECVALPMFSASSSPERRALGLQIFSLAIKKAPGSFLPEVLHANIIRCITDQRAKPERLLFEASKPPLDQMASRAKEDPAAAVSLACGLLGHLPGNIDKHSKTTLEAVLVAIEPEGLETVVTHIVALLKNPAIEDTGDAEKKRRMLSDALLQLPRSRRGNKDDLFSESAKGKVSPHGWLAYLLRSVVELGFETLDGCRPQVTGYTRTLLRERLGSILSDLLAQPAALAVLAFKTVAKELHTVQASSELKISDEGRKAVKQAYKLQKEAATSTSKSSCAFQLLLCLGILQIYQQEPDALSLLNDIVICYKTPREDEDANVVLVELVLSFVAKQSALFKTSAEQIFSAFASDVSIEGLNSMIDILQQKEGLAGQAELFQQDGEESEDSGSDAENSDEAIDVEDMSDVDMTLLNGHDEDASDMEEDQSQGDSGSEGEMKAGAEDDTELKRKAAVVLGTANPNDDSDDDGSEMNDDQMIEADKHLIIFFREQKKVISKKQENKDAKANIVNFKNRVLDLLAIYVKSQYANVYALDLILPLVTTIHTTGSPPTAKKAFGVLEKYFDMCKKQKTLPQPEDTEAVFQVLADLHNSMRLGGSKLHASACSRASQFLAKVLVAKEADGSEDTWGRIHGMYGQLLKEWRQGKSKVHVSIFNEWHSWCLQR